MRFCARARVLKPDAVKLAAYALQTPAPEDNLLGLLCLEEALPLFPIIIPTEATTTTEGIDSAIVWTCKALSSVWSIAGLPKLERVVCVFGVSTVVSVHIYNVW